MRNYTTKALFWLWLLIIYVLVFVGAYFYNTMAKAPNTLLLIGVIALFSLIFIPIYLAIWRSIEKREARKTAKQHLRF